MSVERVVLLVGSARPSGESTSEALGVRLLHGLAEHGVRTEIHRVAGLTKPAGEFRFYDALDATDLFVLSTPLYVDALPYLVTRALERIARRRRKRPGRFVAIVNCGFPEAFHTWTALDICRAFARRAGFVWAGGLGLGGGEAIHGRRLEEVGGMARSAGRALDLAAEALADDRAVPDEAVRLVARPLAPGPLYTFLASWRWRREAWRNGVLRELGARPYAPGP